MHKDAPTEAAITLKPPVKNNESPITDIGPISPVFTAFTVSPIVLLFFAFQLPGQL